MGVTPTADVACKGLMATWNILLDGLNGGELIMQKWPNTLRNSALPPCRLELRATPNHGTEFRLADGNKCKVLI